MISRSTIQNNPIAHSFQDQSINYSRATLRNPITQDDVEIRPATSSKKVDRNPILQDGGNAEGNSRKTKNIERNPIFGEEPMSVRGI